MSFPRILLIVSGLLFVVIGIGFLVAPVVWGEWVNVFLPTSTGRTDVRATYGGFDLGFGLFLLYCAARPEWFTPGLAALALALGGFAGGRILGMIIEGTAIPRMLLLAVEVVGLALTLVALWRRR